MPAGTHPMEYLVWNQRNVKLWRNLDWNPSQRVPTHAVLISYLQDCQKHPEKSVRWLKPPHGMIKFYVDAAIVYGTRKVQNYFGMPLSMIK